MNQKDNDIQSALEAIANIRETVRGNMQLVRPLFLDNKFIPLCITCSISCAVLSGCLIAFMIIWPAGNVPVWVNTAFLIISILLLAGCSAWKVININSAIKKRDKSMNVLHIAQFPEVATLMTDNGITAVATAIICFAVGYESGNWWVFFPGCYIYAGINILLVGSKYEIAEYRAFGIIAYAIAVIMVIFMRSYYELWFLGTLSFYFACYAVILHHTEKHRLQKV